MNNYFLDLHKEWMETGEVPGVGLCTSFKEHKDVFDLLRPSNGERNEVGAEGLSVAYWASEMIPFAYNISSAYTPLRQTIVLFCHEILNTP